MTRRQEFDKIFSACTPEQKMLIAPLIDEVIFLEMRMEELKRMPFIAVHPRNPQLQRSTPAAKQYKECSQSYMNAVRIMLGVLTKVEPSAADELMEKLAAFK